RLHAVEVGRLILRPELEAGAHATLQAAGLGADVDRNAPESEAALGGDGFGIVDAVRAGGLAGGVGPTARHVVACGLQAGAESGDGLGGNVGQGGGEGVGLGGVATEHVAYASTSWRRAVGQDFSCGAITRYVRPAGTVEPSGG